MHKTARKNDVVTWMPKLLLQTVADNISEILLLIEPGDLFRVLWANSLCYEYLGQPEVPLIGRPLYEVVAASQRRETFEFLKKAADLGGPLEIERYDVKGLHGGAKYGLPDNLTCWQLKLIPLNDADYRIVALLIIGSDLTEGINLPAPGRTLP